MNFGCLTGDDSDGTEAELKETLFIYFEEKNVNDNYHA